MSDKSLIPDNRLVVINNANDVTMKKHKYLIKECFKIENTTHQLKFRVLPSFSHSR